jgi:hypothetical protein
MTRTGHVDVQCSRCDQGFDGTEAHHISIRYPIRYPLGALSLRLLCPACTESFRKWWMMALVES